MDGLYTYNGNVSDELFHRALDAFNTYRSDKETLIQRIKDNERFYRRSYSYLTHSLEHNMYCDTPLIFSSIENTVADSVENFPSPNILERDPDGSDVADCLSKIVPVVLEQSDFKRVYKENMRNKLKYGTAIYGLFYNERSNDIDVRALDILDVYVDMHIQDIQDSEFLFIVAAIDNDILRDTYPLYADLFTGDAVIETLTDDYQLKNRTEIIDCYYKKTDGTLHMFKLCKNTIISATEDTEGYEFGLYDHGLYPVIFDVLYSVEHCPFGFGMIDISKATQIEINKLDRAITENIMCNSKPRFLSKRNGGIDEDEFKDFERNIVHYEGDTQSIVPFNGTAINEYFLSHRETKKDELKELLANRDFQQGSTSGGVTAASAIQTLQDAGEKRARSLIDDSYDCYKAIVKMMIELFRQFYSNIRTFRVTDDFGQKDFANFDRSMLFDSSSNPMYFDIDVIPQRENPYTREKINNTILTFWQSGVFLPQNLQIAVIALKNMHFEGKEKLISDLQEFKEQYDKTVAQQQTLAQGGVMNG